MLVFRKELYYSDPVVSECWTQARKENPNYWANHFDGVEVYPHECGCACMEEGKEYLFHPDWCEEIEDDE